MTPEEYYAEITEMQAHWNGLWRDKKRWIIVEEGDGTYSIHEHMTDGVAPPATKPDKRAVASRLLQLLGIGPVAPQDYPEEICVGEVGLKSADIVQLHPKEPETPPHPAEAKLQKLREMLDNSPKELRDTIRDCIYGIGTSGNRADEIFKAIREWARKEGVL